MIPCTAIASLCHDEYIWLYKVGFYIVANSLLNWCSEPGQPLRMISWLCANTASRSYTCAGEKCSNKLWSNIWSSEQWKCLSEFHTFLRLCWKFFFFFFNTFSRAGKGWAKIPYFFSAFSTQEHHDFLCFFPGKEMVYLKLFTSARLYWGKQRFSILFPGQERVYLTLHILSKVCWGKPSFSTFFFRAGKGLSNMLYLFQTPIRNMLFQFFSHICPKNLGFSH